MTRLELEQYCLAKAGSTKAYPFDEKTAVYKVANKMFALCSDEGEMFINLKCDPLYALELRSVFKAVTAGYHMNKKHWNSVYIAQDMVDEQIYELVDDSYNLVFSSLTKKVQNELK